MHARTAKPFCSIFGAHGYVLEIIYTSVSMVTLLALSDSAE
jgi:hypothetical protein